MKKATISLHEKPKYEVSLKLSKKQLKVLQDALDFAAWQFSEGGADTEASIKLLHKMHDKIKKQTGVEED